MINLDRFRNKEIVHEIVKIHRGNLIVSLPEETVFTGEVEGDSDEYLYFGCLSEVSKPLRNFRFMIVKDNLPFLLPYNYTFVGTHIYASPDDGARSVSVYVEKEL